MIRYLLGRPIEEVNKCRENGANDNPSDNVDDNPEDNQPENLPQIQLPSPKKENSFTCSQCEKEFPSLNRLRKHRRLGCEKDNFKVSTIDSISTAINSPKSPKLIGQLEPQNEEFYFQEQISIPFNVPSKASWNLTPSYEIDQDFTPTWMIPHSNESQFTVGYNPVTETQEPPSETATRLVFLSSLLKENLITSEEKRIIKNLILQKNEMLDACWDVFYIDEDLDEFIDSIRTIIKQQITNDELCE